MHDPIITLTTDFGEDSPYVAAVKGVILAINPRVRLIDLSHEVPPQDLHHAAFFLAASVPYFPPDVLHVVVVDPGVGTERPLLYVEVAGHRLLVPDNGCWTELTHIAAPSSVRRLAEPRYWRQAVSATFHGRDILAPVAAHLSLGLDPALLGPVVANWVTLEARLPSLGRGGITGEVAFVDHFGNLITNIPAALLEQLAGRDLTFQVGDLRTRHRVRTYGDADPGTLVALMSSGGMLELAIAQGNAARQLHAGVGTPVRVIAGPGAPANP
jgi:S-adenosylmethionine hydrolase